MIIKNMEIIQSFKNWFRLKIMLWHKEKKLFFKEKELWWCSLGLNLGEEVFGKGAKFTRPVLIFKKFTANSFLGLPITKQEKQGSWYVKITIHQERRWVMLNQARILDKKRLTNRIGALDNMDFLEVKKRFVEFYNSP